LLDIQLTEGAEQRASLVAHLYGGPVQLVEFVREGWRRLNTTQPADHEIIQSDNFYLTPHLDPGTTATLLAVKDPEQSEMALASGVSTQQF
jgi:hypothetical protein